MTLRASLRCTAHEIHEAETGPGLPHDGFDLHTVEFDDQGRPWSEQSMAMTLASLETTLRTAERGTLVVTFVPGWRHNGAPCDNHVACFRDVLEVLAKGERHFAGLASQRLRMPVASRRVVGVIVGWRGETLARGWKVLLNAPHQFTFFSRKHTAHVVGDNGAVTALVEGIRARVRTHSGLTRPSTAVFFGHSFGGALLLSAMGTSFNGALQEATRDAAGRLEVGHDGALFFLVNPAVEGSRFQHLYTTVAESGFVDTQLPILLTMASEADKPVKAAFPVGQSLATWSRSVRNREQWQSMLQGVGQYKPFHTHVLEAKPGAETPREPAPEGPCACSSGLRNYGDALISRLTPVYTDLLDDLFPDATKAGVPRDFGSTNLNLAAFREFLYSTLEQTRPFDKNAPFLTVKVDDDIVGGHSSIFNDRFLDFFIEYTILAERKRQAQRGERTRGHR